ncbi:hypothetical protein M407DRAFT_30709 [Tulasnella calospora MUT 4182]|uniref:Protein kinase domain-containing protein n=1 Tax=Tulasnella calospora MUT 4182 TaxID=1051891 RepID=A0A0C3KDW1_9AGAM|nr:hypothetical protein M407DRAFT_30709 [Tulasnella calospora MUT 4182]
MFEVDKERRRKKKYVQPQWVVDCVNAGNTLLEDAYAQGKTLPPHLSPFNAEGDGAYDPLTPVLGMAKALADLDEDEEDEDEAEDSEDEEDEDFHMAPPQPGEKSKKRHRRRNKAAAAAAAAFTRKGFCDESEEAGRRRGRRSGGEEGAATETAGGASEENMAKMLLSSEKRRLYTFMKRTNARKEEEKRFSNALMQENKEHAPSPPQAPGSDQGDSHSVFLQSFKLRNKLEKLARWRIDPSLIAFSGDAREFRGGFATVSQAFLAPRSSAEGVANKSKHSTERLDLNARNLQALSDTQRPRDDEKGGDDGQDRHPVKDGNDRTEEEGEKKLNDDEEQRSPPQNSNPKIVEEATSPEHTADEGPDEGHRNPRSQSDAQKLADDQQGQDETTDRRIVDGGNDDTKDVAIEKSENTNGGQNSGHQTAGSKIVAVKKIKIERDTDLERALGLALRESEFLVDLSHPNIVKLEGFVEDVSAQKVWLIFPWEEHGNLRDFLASGEWEVPERISLVHDVTLGLEYLHSQAPPIYHGDLKSLNILVDSKCHGVITDFGSARHLGDDHAGKQPKENKNQPQPAVDPNASEEHISLEALFSATASTLSLTGSSYTLRWAAPELLQDDTPCLRSDIWALGWIAYEVMTNTIPFHDVKKDAIVINRVIQGHLPSVTEHARMSLIRALCSLMVQCWSINPDGRPTAEECRKSISWMPKIVPAPTLSNNEEASQLRRARLVYQLGQMYRRQADYPSALSCFTEAVNIYTTNNDSRGRAEALRGLADVHRFRSQYAEAVPFYSEALQIWTDLGDESGRASCIFGLAEAHRFRREYGEAAKLYSECLQIHTSIGNKQFRAVDLWGLATVHRLQGKYSEATNLYSEALQINTDIGDRRERAVNLLGLAEVHRYRGEYNKAINLYLETLQIFTDVGDHEERAGNLWSLAQVHRLQQEYSEARKLYSESLQVYTDIGNTPGGGFALWGLAEVHQALHEYDEATQLYSEAMQIFTDVDNKPWRAETLMSLAKTSQKQGHSGEAISFYTEASEVLEEMGDSRRASDALRTAADIRRTLQEATTDSAETFKVGEDPLLPSD